MFKFKLKPKLKKKIQIEEDVELELKLGAEIDLKKPEIGLNVIKSAEFKFTKRF
jgi:hypothetical protein